MIVMKQIFLIGQWQVRKIDIENKTAKIFLGINLRESYDRIPNGKERNKLLILGFNEEVEYADIHAYEKIDCIDKIEASEILFDGIAYSVFGIILFILFVFVHNRCVAKNRRIWVEIIEYIILFIIVSRILLIAVAYAYLYFYPSTINDSMKPIIYLYPEEEKLVTVSLGNSKDITCSYPKYEGKWNVIAKPNGDLTYVDTGRNLYSLYYESHNQNPYEVKADGFVVKGEDTAKFLEEKLEILGLSEREAEEFIVYWLPKLEMNKYNYIRFATEEEINENMPLEITPKPESLIRVMMTYKGLDKPIEVKNQIIETPVRAGYTAVEWGGTEIK